MSWQLTHPTYPASPRNNFSTWSNVNITQVILISYSCCQHSHNRVWQPGIPQPLSSFAQTVLEEDEKFYATFPEARQAAIEEQWRHHQQVSYNQYFEGPGFQFCPGPGIYTEMSDDYDGRSSDARAPYAVDGYSTACYTDATPVFLGDMSHVYSPVMERSGSGVLPVESLQCGQWAEQQSGEEVPPVQYYTVGVP